MRYVVAIDGQGEHDLDFSVMVVEAATPRAAVERVTSDDMGFGRDQDGVAFVLPLDKTSIFSVNDTRHKQVTPTNFSAVVEYTSPALRQFIDPDGGHPRA